MTHKHRNPNRSFMVITGVLAFAVIFAVILFTVMSLQLSDKKQRRIVYTETYQIELTNSLRWDSLSVYLNDSLLWSGTVPAENYRLSPVNRYEEENALLVVDGRTDEVSTFNLDKKGGLILVTKKDGTLSISAER